MQRGVSARRDADERAEATRALIVERALVRLAREGLHGTTLGDVAVDAGLSKGAVTHHFASKDDLLDAVLMRCAERLAAHLAAAVDGRSLPGDRLRGLVDAAWGAFEADDAAARGLALLSAAALHDPRLRLGCTGAWAAATAVTARSLGETLAVLGLRPRIPLEAAARHLLASAAGHRLTRGDASAAESRRAFELGLYALFEL